MLEIRRLSLRHPAPLHNISFACAAGEVTVILGPNGAGKSTLLHAIGGYYPTAAGEILLAGEPLASIDAARLAAWMPDGKSPLAGGSGRVGSRFTHADHR